MIHTSQHDVLAPPCRAALDAAAEQARLAEGRTSPNPPVGAVVVRDDAIVGRGATQPPGGPHAERVALAEAGDLARGADLYVTLEPCTFHGRTPPCTDAIIAAGIRRVLYVAPDPDPRIGAGAAHTLGSAGLEVRRLPDPGGAVAELLAPFRCRVLAGRPLVTAKVAVSLDGKIATSAGESRWITGPDARREVHRLRDRADAILVGVGTALADDPELTTRLEDHWRPPRDPLRIVLDSRGRTPLSARLMRSGTLFATAAAPPAWSEAVCRSGAEVVRLPGQDERVDLPALLALLAGRGVNRLLVEGGAEVLGAFASQGLLDEVWTFVAPLLIGGATAPGPLGGAGVARLSDATKLTVRRVEPHGPDLLIVAASAGAPWWNIEETSHVHRDR
ncbi:MAG: hypothetical protein RLZZ387_1083 [Chloroflexota bacterium]